MRANFKFVKTLTPLIELEITYIFNMIISFYTVQNKIK